MRFHFGRNSESNLLPDGRPLIKAKPVKKMGEKDYGIPLVEALELQNFFQDGNNTTYGGDNVLYMTPSELKRCALLYHETKKPTIEHIVKSINNTKNITTFFESIDKLIEITNTLQRFEKLNIFLPGHAPSEQLHKNLSNMQSIEDRFIKRNYAVFIEKLEALKTESAKKKRLEKYFAEWSIFYYRMCPESIEFLEQLKRWWKLE